MRRSSFTSPTQIVRDDNDVLLGIDLGADFCAEHEWGIKPLRTALGMTDDRVGVAKYTAHKHSHIFCWTTTDKAKGLLVFDPSFGHWEEVPDTYETALPQFSELKPYVIFDSNANTSRPRSGKGSQPTKQYETVVGGWSDRDFGIHTTTPETTAALLEIWGAIQKDDFGLMVRGTMNPFERGGLVVFIVSRLPQEIDERIKATHLDQIALKKAADKTQIVQKIDKINIKARQDAGHPYMANPPCEYLALSPEWAENWNTRVPNRPTKHPVIFWLNPFDQESRYWGRVTVEELEQWMKGEGWIMQKDHAKEE